MSTIISRRLFIAGAGAFGAASMLGLSQQAHAEPPPEITTIRLVHGPYLCYAPQYLAEELLRMEGFTKVEYIVPVDDTWIGFLAKGHADFVQFGTPTVAISVDAGEPIVALSGVHVGCWELFGNDRVRAIRDLRGKKIAVAALRSADYLWISAMTAYLGIDPRSEIDWIFTGSIAESMRQFTDGKVDAFLGFAPQPYEMRARKIGHVIVNTSVDRPWSQYFCCMLTTRRDFVTSYPVATKRALRALLKAQDICARDPELAARILVAKGYEPRFEVGLSVLKELPYNRWRDTNPEDSIRFHALRLHEAGMIKANPNEIIARGTDWRFLNDLKKELKA